jgi:hypothetical protein
MKSFYQIAEQARKHKNLRELANAQEAEPAQAQTNMQSQNLQQAQAQAPNATNPPEMNDGDVIAQLSKAWDAFAKQNNAALAKLKDIQPAQQLAQVFNNLPAEMKKIGVSIQQKQTQAAGGNKPAPNTNAAGSNTAGGAAGATNVKPPAQV